MSSKKINNREIRLKTIMLKSGIKGIDIAKSTRLSRSMITRYLKGERNSPRIDQFFNKLKKNK